MLELFAQAEKIAPLPNAWDMIVQGGAMALLAFGIVYVLPTFLKNMWLDRDKDRAERSAREIAMDSSMEKDRAARHEMARIFQQGLTETWTRFEAILEKREERFDRRLVQAFEQMKGYCKFASPE